MAQAPKCQHFPSCGKRHYGDCGTAQEPQDKRARPKKKSAVERKPYIRHSDDDPTWIELIAELQGRVESLEARVLELESRKKYMREYQRTRRAEEKGDG